MSASMTEHISRRLMGNPGGGMAQVHKEVSEERYRDLRRPRKVRFFVNGDRFFKGKKLYITPHRYYNFNDLLNDLTGKLPSSINLPYGVRQIFTPVGGRRVSNIEDMQDGETYVCAGFEGFKVIKYGRTELEPWSVGKTGRLGQLPDGADAGSEAGSYKYRGYATNAFHPGRYFRTNGGPQADPKLQQQNPRRWPGTFGNTGLRNPAGLLGGPTEAVPVKPKVVTIIRNGPRPRNNVKILLNRRSVQSFEQLMADISEAFGAKWKGNRVQKLFTTHGKEVKGVSDFFREDDCFIALGGERMSDHDVADIIEELYPDSAYAKMLIKDWEKQRRKDKQRAARELETGVGMGMDDSTSKRDSGFVEGSEADTYRGGAGGGGGGVDPSNDYDNLSTHRSSQRPTHRSKRAQAVAAASERDSLMGSESGSPQSYYMLSKLERERKQAASDERDKARKKQHRLADQERKALDEERKRRGLAPLNPLKPLDDIRRKDPKEKEASRKRKEEEARRKIEEEKEAELRKKESLEREQAEARARERMAAAEKVEREKEEKERKEREKAAEKEAVAAAAAAVKAEKENKEKAADKNSNNNNKNKANNNNENNNKQDKDKHNEKDKESEAAAAAADKESTTATNVTNRDRPDKAGGPGGEKKANKKDDKNSSRKAKPKVVRRSKPERQVSSDSFVSERYELGRALGDGNFAIVRTSRQKASGHEFAMKVIDKPKLKGKEHMVENEIDIMKDCAHPNIVKLYEEYETSDKIYLVMELVKGGDLFDAITQSVKFGESDAAHMVKDLCNALYYLHSRSIVHRDLKPENLLVHRNKDSTITLKLADFGLAMEVKEPIFTVCGTPTYVAPEILTEIGYGLEVDMWAVGVITYILLCGFPPFRSPDRNQTELFEFIKAGEYDFLSPYWDNVSDSAKDLIRRLLIVDKGRRYTSTEVLSHPWIVCGGDMTQPLPGIANIATYCKEIRRDLEEQAKVNYDSYQAVKEKKRQEE